MVTCRDAVVYTVDTAVIQNLAVTSVSGDLAQANTPDVTLTVFPQAITVSGKMHKIKAYAFDK